LPRSKLKATRGSKVNDGYNLLWSNQIVKVKATESREVWPTELLSISVSTNSMGEKKANGLTMPLENFAGGEATILGVSSW